jgi:uncharacterized membrane protein YbhN (UPF0104 family)
VNAAVSVATNAPPAPGDTAARPASRNPVRRPRIWVLGGTLALLLVALSITGTTVDTDSGHDLLGLTRKVAGDIAVLRWQYAAVVVVLAALHYLATALAAKAAAGVPLRLGETVLVQLSAAAANRITPAGLGGSALTARFFTRRGLDGPAAIGAVSALAVLGAFADLIVLCGLVLVGTWLGIGGGSSEVTLLYTHMRHLLGPLRSPWLWSAVLAAVAGALVIWLVHTRRRRGSGLARFWVPIRRLARRPRALGTLMTASGATTLLLGIAFVASTAMVPGTHPSVTFAGLLVAFMIGAAAGSAVPVPAGLGSTEAALVAVLMSAHVPAGHAVEVVMIFRLITFWAPAVVGVFASRRLYRLAAL